MKLEYVFLFIVGLITFQSSAQELNCSVTIQLAPSIQESNRTVYDKLQTDLRELMNSRKWTTDAFLNQERIECSIVITINERPSTDEFKANIQIQSRRPVYKTSYNTPMLNHQDNNFTFRYVQDQSLEFDESNVTSNLTAVVSYYAYIIIGLDYDSFSPEGGTPYFAKAQSIVNAAQNLQEAGWKQYESLRNRYWLAENLMNVSFKPLRQFFYTYHRLGFDRFSENIIESRAAIVEGMKAMKTVYQDKPNSYIMQIFCTTKSDEIVNLFSQALPDEKARVVEIMSMVDPANIAKYQQITAGSK